MIQGLSYIPNYLTLSEEYHILQRINAQEWEAPFQRRVQQYGYVYDYRRRTVDETMSLGDLPDWLADLSHRLQHEGLFATCPDQVIINEYEIGQGIAPHVDCEPCFEHTIVSISLGSQCIMDFYAIDTDEIIHQPLEQRSLICMTDHARYGCKHGIIGRKTDMINDKRIARQRRISLTFRKVILNYSK